MSSASSSLERSPSMAGLPPSTPTLPSSSHAPKSTSPAYSMPSCPSTQTSARHLVDCLRYLFEAAELAHLPDAPRLHLRLEAFIRQELVPKSAGTDTSLASCIFTEIDAISPWSTTKSPV
ncbi:hypothetical protein OG21DRAFT_1487648 [Imleria badia]|nr:hypothetical protein OG21DRAFT_1487648 [Imleria badia]